MSMADYDRAVDLMNQSAIRRRFAGPRRADLVESAENTVGMPFPPAYRRFVLEYGAGNFGSFEVYGVIGPNFESGTVPNGIWFTLDERRTGFPAFLLIIHSLGDGSLACLDLRAVAEGNEAPVVVYYPGAGAAAQSMEVIASDFGWFFLDGIKREVSHS